MQSSLGKRWERNQNTTACSEGISSRRKNDILRQYNDKFIMCSDRACGIILSQSRRLPPLSGVSDSKFISVRVQSPTEINAPRGCAVIL